MGMSTYITGFALPDAEWLRMKAIWDACKAGGVVVPVVVEQFFGYAAPDPAGIKIQEADLLKSGAVKPYKLECRDGYEVEISKLPANVKFIRFVNSY